MSDRTNARALQRLAEHNLSRKVSYQKCLLMLRGYRKLSYETKDDFIARVFLYSKDKL